MSAPMKSAPTVAAESGRDQNSGMQSKTGAAVYRNATAQGSRTAVIEAQRKRDRAAKVNPPMVYTSPELKFRLLSLALEEQSGNSTETQVARTLTALADGDAVTTTEFRLYLDVPHPAGRIKTLVKDLGHQIEMTWVHQRSYAGVVHRVGQYRLTQRQVA